DELADDLNENYAHNNVYELNQQRHLKATEPLLELIEFSLKMEKETSGYYQPLIGRLSHLWKDALENGSVVSENMIKFELGRMETSSIKIEGLDVYILGDAYLDLGGIAKGYATEQAKKYLEEIGCKNYLLNAGNSNIVLGSKCGQNFKVGLSTAFTSEYYHILELQNIAIGTSSIREQKYLIDGNWYSHLINPMTGYPAEYYETFSILGDDSGILDAYSTACFCMELENAKEFLDKRGLSFVCSKDNKLYYQSLEVEKYE
ncbi:MAG: FAD:protein FMN transferase, partial [Anaeroplasmataceae bacterium]|nr:FAD:protein FMN transferase [Anaeroplasmataceae bacterium]